MYIHAASHVDHEKIVAWFSSSMLSCGTLPFVMVFRLAALGATGAPLRNLQGSPVSGRPPQTGKWYPLKRVFV